MSFSETYRAEVLQSRRDRSRRAFFWSRILGLVLMITIAVALRTEPDLRRAISSAAMDGVARLAGLDRSGGTDVQGGTAFAQNSRQGVLRPQASPFNPANPQPGAGARLPASKVKVNRPGFTPAFQPTEFTTPDGQTIDPRSIDPAAMATQIQRVLESISIAN